MTDTSASQPDHSSLTESSVAAGPVTPAPTATETTAPKPRRIWDIALSIVLMLLGAVVVVLMFFPTIFLPMASDSCGTTTCNQAQMSLGMILAFVSPTLVMLIASIIAIVLIVRRKLSFWVVLVGIILAIAAWAFSITLVFSSVPNFEAPSLLEILSGFAGS